MFYCDTCASVKQWPESFNISYGRCEVCGDMTKCNDVESSRLSAKPVNTQPRKPNELMEWLDVREK